jgi:hypothetical protein
MQPGAEGIKQTKTCVVEAEEKHGEQAGSLLGRAQKKKKKRRKE